MTISLFEFTDLDGSSGEPIWPEIRRRAGQSLSNTYLQLGETASIAAVLISNDDGTTGVRVRFSVAGSGVDATQADVLIAANSYQVFRFHRKVRASTNPLYINAVADT